MTTLGRNPYRRGRYSGSKSQNFTTPLSFRALDWGDPYGIFGKALQILKLVFGAADGEDLMILARTVFA